jgi:hypothetical protein
LLSTRTAQQARLCHTIRRPNAALPRSAATTLRHDRWTFLSEVSRHLQLNTSPSIAVAACLLSTIVGLSVTPTSSTITVDLMLRVPLLRVLDMREVMSGLGNTRLLGGKVLMSMGVLVMMMFMKRKIPSIHSIQAMPAISDSESAFGVVRRKTIYPNLYPLIRK